MIGKAEFLEPLVLASPVSGLPPRIRKTSMLEMLSEERLVSGESLPVA